MLAAYIKSLELHEVELGQHRRPQLERVRPARSLVITNLLCWTTPVHRISRVFQASVTFLARLEKNSNLVFLPPNSQASLFFVLDLLYVLKVHFIFTHSEKKNLIVGWNPKTTKQFTLFTVLVKIHPFVEKMGFATV